MTYIPKTQEPEYQRRMRLLTDQMDSLTSQVERLAKAKSEEVKLPDPKQEVPEAIKFAAGFLHMYQQTTMPRAATNDLDIEWCGRIPDACEESAVTSACELLEDFFDRHNSRVLRERQRAETVNQETRRRGKRTAIPVTREEIDE